MFRTVLLTVLAAALALLVDLAIATVAPHFIDVPKDFPPFTFLPILSGAAGGALLASLVYALLKAVSSNPDRLFLFTVVTVLALSFALPLRLSFTRSPRFAGVTPAAQMVLVLMHTVVATATVVSLLAGPR